MLNNGEQSYQSLIDYVKNYFKLIEQKGNDIRIIDMFRGKAKSPDWPAGKICYLWEKKVMSPFGFDDKVYYYMIAKKDGWYHRWADEDNAGSKKWQGTPGCSFQASIYAHMEMHPELQRRSAFVVGIPDPLNKSKITFHYVTVPKLMEFVRKYGTIFTARFNQEQCGFPQTITNQMDPYK